MVDTPLTERSVHLCVDMQRLFSEDGPWPTPWLERVLPAVVAIAERFPERTVFTRMIPPYRPEQMPGVWNAYYSKWRKATREALDPHLVDLVPPLCDLVPPATIMNKTRYSAFAFSSLARLLSSRHVDALVVTGAETDMCVLATVLGAIDRGYRVVIAEDAVCSFSDAGHDALIRLYQQRFSVQIETATHEEILKSWR